MTQNTHIFQLFESKLVYQFKIKINTSSSEKLATEGTRRRRFQIVHVLF